MISIKVMISYGNDQKVMENLKSWPAGPNRVPEFQSTHSRPRKLEFN